MQSAQSGFFYINGIPSVVTVTFHVWFMLSMFGWVSVGSHNLSGFLCMGAIGGCYVRARACSPPFALPISVSRFADMLQWVWCRKWTPPPSYQTTLPLSQLHPRILPSFYIIIIAHGLCISVGNTLLMITNAATHVGRLDSSNVGV